MNALVTMLDVIGTACMVTGFVADRRRREDLGDLLFGLCNAAYIPGDITGANWRWMLPLNIVLAVFFLALWWRRRRGRERVAKLIGAKSRALLAAMIRTVRERSRPRPVFRPVPGRAG